MCDWKESELRFTRGRSDWEDSSRQRMIRDQIIARGIDRPKLIDAFRRVPRHLFVPAEVKSLAYADQALPTEFGQTISQPYTVARMIEGLQLVGTERVLDVGTGSGYAAAILACLVPEVTSIERIEKLGLRASARFVELGIHNIHVHIADGSKGLIEFAPYDAILVSAAATELPQQLVDQLSESGRMVIPIGSANSSQSLMRYTRTGVGLRSENLGSFAFVPLIVDSE